MPEFTWYVRLSVQLLACVLETFRETYDRHVHTILSGGGGGTEWVMRGPAGDHKNTWISPGDTRLLKFVSFLACWCDSSVNKMIPNILCPQFWMLLTNSKCHFLNWELFFFKWMKLKGFSFGGKKPECKKKKRHFPQKACWGSGVRNSFGLMESALSDLSNQERLRRIARCASGILRKYYLCLWKASWYPRAFWCAISSFWDNYSRWRMGQKPKPFQRAPLVNKWFWTNTNFLPSSLLVKNFWCKLNCFQGRWNAGRVICISAG